MEMDTYRYAQQLEERRRLSDAYIQAREAVGNPERMAALKRRHDEVQALRSAMRSPLRRRIEAAGRALTGRS